MKSKQTADRERRVDLALKWHHLDNCNVEEIQERFIEHGYGEFARSTIYDYLKEAPAEEVLRQPIIRQAVLSCSAAQASAGRKDGRSRRLSGAREAARTDVQLLEIEAEGLVTRRTVGSTHV